MLYCLSYNILVLLNRNQVKLADFGVAAELNENDRRYSVVGTPYWVSFFCLFSVRLDNRKDRNKILVE